MDETKYIKFTDWGGGENNSFWNVKYNFEKENRKVIQ